MNKTTQLVQAKALATVFLHLPMEETQFSPMVVQHPFFESAVLWDKEGLFNALEDEVRYERYISYFSENAIGTCKDLSSLFALIRKSYHITFLLYMEREESFGKRSGKSPCGARGAIIELGRGCCDG